MGETAVYYVPSDQTKWSGKSLVVTQCFWDRGIHLSPFADGFSEMHGGLPSCEVDIDRKFGGMGVADETAYYPVPNQLWDVRCSHCGEELLDQYYDALSCTKQSEIDFRDRRTTCNNCNTSSSVGGLAFGEPMTFAKFYIWVSDCNQSDWPSEFHRLVESVLGPCEAYWEWST